MWYTRDCGTCPVTLIELFFFFFVFLNIENITIKTILKNAPAQYKVYYAIISYLKAIGLINDI